MTTETPERKPLYSFGLVKLLLIAYLIGQCEIVVRAILWLMREPNTIYDYTGFILTLGASFALIIFARLFQYGVWLGLSISIRVCLEFFIMIHTDTFKAATGYQAHILYESRAALAVLPAIGLIAIIFNIVFLFKTYAKHGDESRV